MKTLLRFLFLSIVFAAPLISAQTTNWHLAFPGFKIAGNLYYVGAADLAVYLVRTSKGKILINSDFPSSGHSSGQTVEMSGGFLQSDLRDQLRLNP